MTSISISNIDYVKKVATVTAGDTVLLKSGNYREPIVLQGLVGTEERPIIIRPNESDEQNSVIFTSGISLKEARKRANEAAYARERAGYYPAVGYLGDQALMILRNCRYVIIQGLNFEDCWPTGIYLDQSQYIAIDGVNFKGGTIAIGANGIDTHDLIIQNCTWQQDTTGFDMWNKIPWSRIHGASNNSALLKVDIKKDSRHFDGDFFRSWNIAGNVIIRNNEISDAFNAIHCFNSFDRLAPGVDANGLVFNGGKQSTANILIENNHFTHIRDNVIEPEYHAWNWVVRHNHIYDCYRPFSFEFERAGYFYIYGNTASFVTSPSMQMSDDDEQVIPQSEWRRSVSLFKPKGTQKNEGPLYIFNNSWHMELGKGIFPKFALGKLIHTNNAMEFKKPKKARIFGKGGDQLTGRPLSLAKELESEKARFTRRWEDFQIEMNSDVANDQNFPNKYRELGYSIGLTSVKAKPGFKNPLDSNPQTRSFVSKSPKILNKAADLHLELPDGLFHKFRGGHHIGAAQKSGEYNRIDKVFEFVPNDNWLPIRTS